MTTPQHVVAVHKRRIEIDGAAQRIDRRIEQPAQVQPASALLEGACGPALSSHIERGTRVLLGDVAILLLDHTIERATQQRRAGESRVRPECEPSGIPVETGPQVERGWVSRLSSVL